MLKNKACKLLLVVISVAVITFYISVYLLKERGGVDVVKENISPEGIAVTVNSKNNTSFYKNNKFGFSVQYPCDETCQLNPSGVLLYSGGVFQKHNRRLPTEIDGVYVELQLLSMEEMQVVYDMFESLELRLEGQTVLIGKKKGFEINSMLSVKYPIMRTTYIPLDESDGIWLAIRETAVSQYLKPAIETDNKSIKKYLTATKKVLDTLSFF